MATTVMSKCSADYSKASGNSRETVRARGRQTEIVSLEIVSIEGDFDTVVVKVIKVYTIILG